MREPKLRVALVLAATLCMAGAARAAKLPDWAQSVADRAPEVPQQAPDLDAQVLFREDRLSVASDGTFRLRRRLALQALSNRAAQDVRIGVFHFSEGAKLSKPRAWHLPAGKKAERGHEPPIDLSLEDTFLTDERARLMALAGVKKGSIVFYEFEAEEAPPTLAFASIFYDGAPTRLSRLVVESPPAWAVRAAWLRENGPEPSIEGDVRIWELRDLRWSAPEPLGDPPGALAPLLVIAFDPPAGTPLRSAAIADWPAFSRWFEDLARGRDAVVPQIEAASRAAGAGAGPDFFDQVGAVASFVRDKVRYVAKEVGIGGYQPRPARQVVQDLYGDCKDKSTLLRAMLSVQGKTSYPVLIHATRASTVSDEVPYPGAFNHMVLGVVVPDGVTVPKDRTPVIVDAGDLGRLLILDTTVETMAFGELQQGLYGKRAFVVAGERGRLITLPRAEPAVHRIERDLDLRIEADRSRVFELASRFFGESAARERESYRASSVEHRQRIEHALFEHWPDAVVLGHDTESESQDGAFVRKVRFRIPAATPPQGVAETIEIFPLAVMDLDRVSLGRRTGAVEYEYPRLVMSETSIHGLPEGSEPPREESARGEGWSVSTRLVREGTTLAARREVVVSRTRFEPDAFVELKKLWVATGRTQLVSAP